MENFSIYESPKKAYKEMLKDIYHARKFIFLETYIFDDDIVGRKFREILLKKAKQGVKIKLLLDAWGGTAKKEFFEELISFGAEVRFFREIKYFIRIFSKNHERNHRKLLIIDNKITYIGSMNISASGLNWRELVLRMSDDVTACFARAFYQSWESYGDLNKKRLKSIIHEEFEIIQDIPTFYSKATENRLYRLVGKARKHILIETPYFVPSLKVITTLARAVKKGVVVDLLIPYRSDVRLVDIVRNRYLGRLYKKGIKIHYYTKKTMHSKLLIIDDKFFMLGSSNIDYRSFVYYYELNLVGKHLEMILELKKFFKSGIDGSVPFNYNEWKNRSSFGRIIGIFAEYIKEYL